MAFSMDDLLGMYGIGNNPAKAANKYIGQIPNMAGQYLNPYIAFGNNALPGLQEQYGQLLGNPGEKLNQMGMNYQQSPGFKFALDQALTAGNQSASAGGMAGSPAAQAANMQTATDMASKDYNNWMQNALGLYGAGLSGQQGMAGMGLNASTNMANMIAQTLAQQGNLAYGDKSAKNQFMNNALSTMAGAAPFMLMM